MTGRLFACLLPLCLPLAAMAQPLPLGTPGTVARYVLDGQPEERPSFETEHRLSVVEATLQLGPVVEVAGEPLRQWYGLEFSRLNGDRYHMWLLLDGWPTKDHSPDVAQYLWREPGWPDALNFVHEVSGAAQLPRLCLWTYGWPQDPEAGGGSERAPVTGMPEWVLLQGWRFHRVALDVRPDVEPPDKYTSLPLNPDLLNGWLAFDRDSEGRPSYRLGPSEDGSPGRYAYVAKSPQELEAYRTAGANFLVMHPGKRARANFPDWLTRSPMYHNNLAYQSLDWPADLYRANYWGFGNHVDEPGVHNWGLTLQQGPDAPLPEVQAVRSLQRIVRQGVEERGRAAINSTFTKNFGLGSLQMEETPDTIVAWEYEWPTAWYQLAVENGVGGIVDEDATLNDLVESYNMAFETQIPATLANAVAIRVAVLRGAARNFNKRWGVAFYHPNEVKLKAASIPLMYDKGASYFWYWTGWIGITDNSGLPYPYQLYYTFLVREAFLRNRERDTAALLRAAKVAVVIPYGYTFAPYHMHRLDWLHLERENTYGVKYRKVLANAAIEVERLLREGTDFDIAVDDPLFHKSGYDELIYAQADGTIRVERHGVTVERRDHAVPVHRPNLGAEPKLQLEMVASKDGFADKIRIRAIPQIGTGEWGGERPEPLISWEIYGPDNRVSPAVFPEYGPERTLRLDPSAQYTAGPPLPEHARAEGEKAWPVEGAYTIRAATADVFGRPAVAYTTLYPRAEQDDVAQPRRTSK